MDSKPYDAKPIDDKPGDAKPIDDKPGDAKPVDDKPCDAKLVGNKPGDAKPIDHKPEDDLLNRFFMNSETGRLVTASFFLFIHVSGMCLMLLLYNTSEKNLIPLEMGFEIVERMLALGATIIFLMVVKLVGLHYDDRRLMTTYLLFSSLLIVMFLACGLTAKYGQMRSKYINVYIILNLGFNAIPVCVFAIYLKEIKSSHIKLE